MKYHRFVPIIIIVLGLILIFSLGLQRYLSFDSLKTHHHVLVQFTTAHFFPAVLGFIVIYSLSVLLSIPGATFLTIASGLLFGTVLGSILTVLSATLGAIGLFVAMRTSFGELLAQKAKSTAKFNQLKHGFLKNSFYYLLTLRLIPVVPFWLLNIAPALFNMRLKPFALATLIGIIPGSVVYVSLGTGIAHLLTQNQTPNLSIIFEAKVLLPLLGLALLSFLPVLYKKYAKKT